MKENQQVAGSKQARRSTSSHYMEPNYSTLLLDVVDIKGSRHPTTLGLSLRPSLRPSLLLNSSKNLAQAESHLGHSSQTLDHFLKEKGTGHITYLCPNSTTEQHSANNVIPALFTFTDSDISLLCLPQCLSGKMLPVSFDRNSAT